jgi:putative peptidoglycan lipid II flippase
LSLMAYAVGLPGFILIKVLATGFFSRQDTKTPVKIGVIAMLANIVLNLILVIPLDHAGLALATSLSAYINAGLLYFALKKEREFLVSPGWAIYLMKLTLGIIAMAVLLIFFVPDGLSWLAWDIFARVQSLILWILAGAGAYFIVIFLFGIRPIQMTAQP